MVTNDFGTSSSSASSGGASMGQETKARKQRASSAAPQIDDFDTDLAQAMAEGEGFASIPHPDADIRYRVYSPRARFTRFYNNARGIAADRLRDLPGDSREFAGRVDRHARANPWLHIGLASAGGLLIGLVAGRMLAERSSVSKQSQFRGYDFDQAMDE